MSVYPAYARPGYLDSAAQAGNCQSLCHLWGKTEEEDQLSTPTEKAFALFTCQVGTALQSACCYPAAQNVHFVLFFIVTNESDCSLFLLASTRSLLMKQTTSYPISHTAGLIDCFLCNFDIRGFLEEWLLRLYAPPLLLLSSLDL